MNRDENCPRVDYEAIEAAGHILTMVCPLLAGRTCYLCDNCGAFTIHRNGRVILWHNPRREDTACEPRLTQTSTLKQKLADLDREDQEYLLQVI